MELILNKRGQSEYAWIFSLIIGAVIIFLAVFAAQKFKQTGGIQTQAETLRQFDILLNPFASVGSITSMTLSKEIEMPYDVQLNVSCSSKDNFNELNIRTRSGKNYGSWLKEGYKIQDKYLFSGLIEGKKYWIFSKPFEMPWRVDDLIFITDKSYCFDNPPEQIRREVDSLKSNALYVKEAAGCTAGSIEVCFGVRGCAINVNYGLGFVKRDGETLAFSDDATMYGAIFSDPKVYKCNFDRLIDRLRTQIDINSQKAAVLEQRGCRTQALQSSLAAMKSVFAGKLLGNYKNVAQEVEDQNPKECPVFD